MVPYIVGAVVAVTVMHVLLGCEGGGNDGVGPGEVWLR